MRKRDETLRGKLLACAREMVRAGGPEAVNVRELAARAQVATGTVYNYYRSKEDVLLALTEAEWRQALDALPAEVGEPPFVAQAGRMYAYLQSRLQGPAGPLMKSLRGEEPLARERMRAAQRMLREPVARMLAQDAAIAPDIWNERFTRERYADFVLVNLLALLEQKMDCIGFFLDIIKATLYH